MCEQPDQRGFSTDKRTVGTIGCRVFDALADMLGLKRHYGPDFRVSKFCVKFERIDPRNLPRCKDICRQTFIGRQYLLCKIPLLASQ